MGRSKIIKDFISGEYSVSQTLETLYILLKDLDNKELSKWVSNELQGYNNEEIIPEYRIIKGCTKANLNSARGRATGITISVGGVEKEYGKNLNVISYDKSISTIENMLKDKSQKTFYSPVAPEYFTCLQKTVQYMVIDSANVEFSALEFENIISTVRYKVLNILLILEKTFGNLDEHYIDITKYSEDEVKNINKKIYYIVYNNNISIGDNNQFKNSNIK